MSEREMLERAAAAAGYVIESWAAWGACWVYEKGSQPNEDGEYPIFLWHPREDDGDALRLAVRRGICFGPNFDGDAAVAYGDDGRNIVVPHNGDPYAATRLAITRAAAALAPTAQGE